MPRASTKKAERQRRLKISRALRGRSITKKQKKALQRNQFEDGHEVPQEWREKIRNANLDRKFTKERKRKISEALMGHESWITEESVKKMKKSLTGRNLTAEHKNNIRKAHIERGSLKDEKNPNWKGGISKDMKQYRRHKRESDPKYQLDRNMGTAIWQALKENKSSRRWEDLVGYTLEKLKQRLECQFKKGMTWDNYGEWHIDHRKPKSLFDYESSEEQAFKDCWALANLQPLWAEENIKKGGKYEK